MTFDEAKKLTAKYGQEHILRYYDEITDDDKLRLLDRISKIDFEKLDILLKTDDKPNVITDGLEPYEAFVKEELSEGENEKNLKSGAEIMKSGAFAAITMAGGQGTRLGYDGPKGAVKIGLKNDMSLFQIQCERLKVSSEKYGKYIPWYIMTSDENDEQTRNFFEENDYFGYPKEYITFFVQNMLPMTDFNGKIILDGKNHVKEGADGHGGVFSAMRNGGVVEDLIRRGIKWTFIGGVDNVLLRLADEYFVGFAENSGCKVAAKSLIKRDAYEKVGVFCKLNGRPHVVEYTEVSEEMANARNGEGEFLYGEAHILCNIFSTDAIRELTAVDSSFKYHVAKKKTNYVDASGEVRVPDKANGIKFESFIFDAFDEFDKIAILRVERELEFAPVKNAEGEDSPETARKMFEYCESLGDVF